MAENIEIGSATPEQMRLLWQDYLQRKQLAPQLQANFPQRKPIDEPSPHRIFVKNVSGEEIPPYGCMQITGMVNEGGMPYITVTKPTSPCAEYLFNSFVEIAPNKNGWGYSWGVVRMLGSAGGYESCKRYKPTQGSWAVSEGPGPFLVYGADDQIPGTVWGRIVGDHCIARWIVFDYQTGEDNSEVTPTDYWDGPNPTDCGLTTVPVEYPLGEPLCDCEVVAVYDPNTSKYKALDTQASMLGEPFVKKVITDVANEDCGITLMEMELKVFPNSCNPSDEERDVALGTETPVVVSIGSDSCGTINYAVQSARVFICGNTINTVAQAINFDGVQWVKSIAFGAPDCGGAVYKWLYTGGLYQWVLQSGCDCGTHTPPTTPGSVDGEEVTIPCPAPANSLCGLNLTLGTMCEDTGSYGYTPTTVHVPLPLQAREVVVDVVDSGVIGDPVEIHYETLYVCNYTDARVDYLSNEDCSGGSSGGSGGV